MIRFAEYVSLGHPDKTADYISQYLLDRYIEQDPATRYAVEVQVKDHHVTLGGEVSSRCSFTDGQISAYVREAVREIGYTKDYAMRWGVNNTICGDHLTVTAHISQQSQDIARGLDGWGDQGIFFGYANNDDKTHGMPYEHAMAMLLCRHLYNSGIGGIDIKTQVITDNDKVVQAYVAIPLHDEALADEVGDCLQSILPGNCYYTINGTGQYIKHSTIADCGTTGRKLAVDFYGGACRVGGGSPWTKDGSKADLTLNLYARQLAKQYARQLNKEIYTSLACCIGEQTVYYSVSDGQNNIIDEGSEKISPQQLIKRYKLDTPIYASMCRWGLFGTYQLDKEWEIV